MAIRQLPTGSCRGFKLRQRLLNINSRMVVICLFEMGPKRKGTLFSSSQWPLLDKKCPSCCLCRVLPPKRKHMSYQTDAGVYAKTPCSPGFLNYRLVSVLSQPPTLPLSLPGGFFTPLSFAAEIARETCSTMTV